MNVAPGLTTTSKDATSNKGHRYERCKDAAPVPCGPENDGPGVSEEKAPPNAFHVELKNRFVRPGDFRMSRSDPHYQESQDGVPNLEDRGAHSRKVLETPKPYLM